MGSAPLARGARIETIRVAEELEKMKVAPLLREGRGLKHGIPTGNSQPSRRSAPLARGARIETRGQVNGLEGFRVAPLLREGRGLKLVVERLGPALARVAPLLREGRGLKRFD